MFAHEIIGICKQHILENLFVSIYISIIFVYISKMQKISQLWVGYRPNKWLEK